jgi:hypothetical protein
LEVRALFYTNLFEAWSFVIPTLRLIKGMTEAVTHSRSYVKNKDERKEQRSAASPAHLSGPLLLLPTAIPMMLIYFTRDAENFLIKSRASN